MVVKFFFLESSNETTKSLFPKYKYKSQNNQLGGKTVKGRKAPWEKTGKTTYKTLFENSNKTLINDEMHSKTNCRTSSNSRYKCFRYNPSKIMVSFMAATGFFTLTTTIVTYDFHTNVYINRVEFSSMTVT